MKLEIIVQDDRNVRAKRELGQEVSGRINDDLLLMRTIQLLRSLLETGHMSEFDGLRVLGSHLYKLIFAGSIGSEFEKALKESEGVKEER